MPHEFVTLFDSNYLMKAVAMHASLHRHCSDFRLTAYCFDDEAKAILDELALPNLDTVALAELEAHDPELLATKADRSPVEYCWTATPALPLHLLHTRPHVDRVTYLDADLLFFADPQLLFDAIGEASICITPHRFAPEYEHHAVNGIYCVQWVTFTRDQRGMEALQWWHDRCIEWCYYRLEDGKLGDQKYLDDWPERFEGVHVLEHAGGGLAPWNITRYRLTERVGKVYVDSAPLVFYHYHRLRLLSRGYDWAPPGYLITDHDRALVYDPYMQALEEARELVRSVRPDFSAGIVPPPTPRERLQALRAKAGGSVARRAPALARLRERVAARRR
jgi:hypothetical protein